MRRLFDHQRWLATEGRFGKKFAGNEIGFVNCDLQGVDFTQVEFEFASFIGCNLQGARFRNAKLFEAAFTECDIAGADFSGANLRWAAFVKSNHEQALFDGADLTRTAWNEEQETANFKDSFPVREPKKIWPRVKIDPR